MPVRYLLSFPIRYLLRGSIYYKKPIHNSGINQLLHPTVQSSLALISTIEIVFADFRKLVLLVVRPRSRLYSSPCSSFSSALVYCQSPVWLLKHVVVGRGTTFSLPNESPTRLYRPNVRSVFGTVPTPFGRYNLTFPITLQVRSRFLQS